MTITDGLHWIALGNPVSKALVSSTSSIVTRIIGTGGATTTNAIASNMAGKAAGGALPPLWKLAGGNYNYMRLAGLSGASAVILGAIGSHSIHFNQDKGEPKIIFDTANRFHFFHSLALMVIPLAKRPVLSGTLMICGSLLFSGTLYYRAFTSDKRFSSLAPMGGTILILAWLSLLL